MRVTPPLAWTCRLPSIAVLLVAMACSEQKFAPPGPNVDPDGLAGIQVGPAPWPPELEHLEDRLAKLTIPALKVEGHRMDLHITLSVAVDGETVTVPAGIGLNGTEEAGRMLTGFVSPLHSHDELGFIHIHSPTLRHYTLGQVFDVWGVRFTKDCLGGYCSNGRRRVRVFVDKEPLELDDPRTLILDDEAKIAVTYSSSERPPA